MIIKQLPHDPQVLRSPRMREVFLYIEETVKEIRTPSDQTRNTS